MKAKYCRGLNNYLVWSDPSIAIFSYNSYVSQSDIGHICWLVFSATKLLNAQVFLHGSTLPVRVEGKGVDPVTMALELVP